MFKEEHKASSFDWSMLGDISDGRQNLGAEVGVAIYRLMQYTLRDVLVTRYGVRTADEILYEAGFVSGKAFYENKLKKTSDIGEFFSDLQRSLKENKVGILRIESCDFENLLFTLAVAEDLDCSGLPASDEVVCNYDEGFFAGILKARFGLDFLVREIDCWCSGDRVCRFEVKPMKNADL